MEVLPNGMEMDLTRFPGSSANQLTALERPDELDRYTYFVAGCVGEFWTRMVCAHRRRWPIGMSIRCLPSACDSAGIAVDQHRQRPRSRPSMAAAMCRRNGWMKSVSNRWIC